MAIIDIHAEVGTTPIWGVPFTDANLMRRMQKHGIERVVVSSTIGSTCDFRRGNSQIAKIVAANPSLLGCVVANIHYPEQSQEDMHRYLSDDRFASLLLTSGVPGRPVTLKEADEILNAHRRFTKPVYLYTYDKESVLAAAEIAEAFSGMKVVMLSMGGDDWRMATVLAERQLNLVLEVSGSFSPDKIQFAVEHIGSHRMVYGSNLPYVDSSAVIGLVDDADVPDQDKRSIYEASAYRLFGWRKSPGGSGRPAAR